MGVGYDLFVCAFCDNLSTMLARAGTNVNNVIGGTHDLLVVFDHQYSVSKVAQTGERLHQTCVVMLM